MPRPLPTPISDHIVVLPIERPLEVGGMARPQSAAEMPSEGVVVLVGPGRVTEHGVRVKPEVEAGDLVSFPSYAGKLIADPVGLYPGQYLLVRQDELYLNHGPQSRESEPHE
jgi:chaperonin GroES